MTVAGSHLFVVHSAAAPSHLCGGCGKPYSDPIHPDLRMHLRQVALERVETYRAAADNPRCHPLNRVLWLREVERFTKVADTYMTEEEVRLEYLRGELRAERISQGELIELQNLTEHIDPDDFELLEAAGVPEHDDEKED